MTLLDLLRDPALRLLDRVRLPIALVDCSGRLIHVNPALERFSGIPAQQLVGVAVADRVPEDERQRYRDHLTALRRDGVSLFRTWAHLSERRALPMMIVAAALWGTRGEWLGQIVAVLPDDAAEFELASRIVRAGALARTVLREVTAELASERPDAKDGEFAQLCDKIPELARLTPREWVIARRLARGDRTPAIASELRISPNTVRNHLKAVYRKTGTATQAGLVARMQSWRDGRNG